MRADINEKRRAAAAAAAATCDRDDDARGTLKQLVISTCLATPSGSKNTAQLAVWLFLLFLLFLHDSWPASALIGWSIWPAQGSSHEHAAYLH
jgi:hypothetical protein